MYLGRKKGCKMDFSSFNLMRYGTVWKSKILNSSHSRSQGRKTEFYFMRTSSCNCIAYKFHKLCENLILDFIMELTCAGSPLERVEHVWHLKYTSSGETAGSLLRVKADWWGKEHHLFTWLNTSKVRGEKLISGLYHSYAYFLRH